MNKLLKCEITRFINYKSTDFKIKLKHSCTLKTSGLQLA